MNPDSEPSPTSHFLAEVSHEVRSPLHAIIGFSELLADEAFGELNAEQRVVVGDIRCAAGHLLRVITDVLDISRATTDKLDLQLEVLSLAAVVDQALHMARGLAHEKGVTLEADVAPDLAVRADERRVLQVLHNLLANAIRCSPPQGEVRITAEPEEALVWTVVMDHGCGIDTADQERIFDAFVAVKHDDQEPGVGLGLNVCRNLLKAMGGTIQVDSTPGQGSSFRFSLPRAEPPA